jgi:hypothetical protein
MMTSSSDIEIADRLSRRRARMLPFFAILFLTQQAAYFAEPDTGMRAVDHVKVGAWLVLSIVLLLLLATGGSWIRPKRVRALMDDEVTRANRAEAFRIGFLATMAGAIILYFVSQFEPMSGRLAIHMMVTVGIAAALLRFGFLERRAHRDG